MVIVAANETVAQALMRQFPITDAVEGGSGAIVLGLPNVEADPAPHRVAWSHPWTEVDVDRLRALIERKGVSNKIQVLNELPADWRFSSPGLP